MPFNQIQDDEQDFEPVINNSENNSQVMFSLEDSEGIVEIKQDFDDENADFYIP